MEKKSKPLKNDRFGLIHKKKSHEFQTKLMKNELV